MSRLTRMADRWRGIPALATFVAIGLVAIGTFLIFRYDGVYRAQKVAEAQVQADVLAAGVTAALDFGDKAAAQESVDALRVNRQLLAAGVYDARGALFAGFGPIDARRPAEALTEAPGSGGFRVTAPVMRAGGRIGTVALVSTGDPLVRRITRFGLLGLLVGLAALVVGVLGAAQNVLARSNRKLAEANAELLVQIDERGKAEDALRQAQKMQALGQLTGGIAHDFNNLLTVIAGSADLLKRPEVSDEKRVRFASAIAQTADRAAALTSQLLAFARRQPLRPQVIALNAQIRGMHDLLERSLGPIVEVRMDLDEDICPVEVDPTQLEVAILNIAVNARDAMPDGGVIVIRTAASTHGDGGKAVTLAVTDTGQGIPPDVADRVFEPFFTTKVVGKGTGLGLSQVYGFIAQSGGEAWIDSVEGQGTTVGMRLPCTDAPLPDDARKLSAATVATAAHVLLVEDNEEVGTFAETLLAELGHRVTRARGALEALRFIEEGTTFDVVFSDVVMPGMSGIELADDLETRLPDLPVILTSGYSERLAEGTGARPILSKPYRLEALAQALATALSGRAA